MAGSYAYLPGIIPLRASKREEGIVDINPKTCPDPVYTSQVIYWFALWAEFGYKEAAGDEAAKRRQTRERGQLA
ncbi:MAG TPA: hypothetical protein GX530_08445 [Corynebacteriales bacterium]|nr:hypothetical protein [Mycobacteriales bacterium]